MAIHFTPLVVSKLVRETVDAVTIHFKKPSANSADFDYLPGQYLTLRVNIDGKNYNRAFSLCSCANSDDTLAVTVKETPGGKVSTWINRSLKEGMTLEVMPPLGNFVAKPEAGQKKHYVLIGAGSGITPLMSILKTVLNVEIASKVTLMYGNRTPESIIFKSILDKFDASYQGRLQIFHTLSQPGSSWNGESGRLDRSKVKTLLQNMGVDVGAQNTVFYICGPSSMMEEAANALKELQVDPARVHQEHFNAPITNPLDDSASTTSTPEGATSTPDEVDDGKLKKRAVQITMDGKTFTIQVNPDQSVLEAALDHDLDPPYACMIGSCCTCKAKLTRGKVIMDDREGLTDAELRDGYVLTCQSHPTSADVMLNYDL